VQGTATIDGSGGCGREQERSIQSLRFSLRRSACPIAPRAPEREGSMLNYLSMMTDRQADGR